MLVPAALENQITAAQRGPHQGQLILEGANGPTTPDADDILHRRGITVVPDIVANAGGVTVSYFEWVQDLQSFFWEEDEINRCLGADHHRGVRLGLGGIGASGGYAAPRRLRGRCAAGCGRDPGEGFLPVTRPM